MKIFIKIFLCIKGIYFEKELKVKNKLIISIYVYVYKILDE